MGHGLTLSREVGCCVESDGWRGDGWDRRWEYECGRELREETLMEGTLGWRIGTGAKEWDKKRAPEAEMDGYAGGYISNNSCSCGLEHDKVLGNGSWQGQRISDIIDSFP